MMTSMIRMVLALLVLCLPVQAADGVLTPSKSKMSMEAVRAMLDKRMIRAADVPAIEVLDPGHNPTHPSEIG
jgi:hypothetical protein